MLFTKTRFVGKNDTRAHLSFEYLTGFKYFASATSLQHVPPSGVTMNSGLKINISIKLLKGEETHTIELYNVLL